MRKATILLTLLVMLLTAAGMAEEPVNFVTDAEADSLGTIIRSYDTPTLKYTIETFIMHGEKCWLTRVWVKDPERQIRKVTGEWKKSLSFPKTMAGKIPEAQLVINGSGYVSPQFPEIPENYPGESRDYYYTPLGSLTVTDGTVYRNLEGVPYSGLTLTADGLQMYKDAENEAVLAENPSQTWSFYPECPMMRNNEELLPEDWEFAGKRAERTIIARVDRNNYLILTADYGRKGGITLWRANTLFRESFRTEWVYDLDGGPSSALLYRNDSGKWHTVMGGGVKDADIMAFTN